jgi:hypothetical protein
MLISSAMFKAIKSDNSSFRAAQESSKIFHRLFRPIDFIDFSPSRRGRILLCRLRIGFFTREALRASSLSVLPALPRCVPEFCKTNRGHVRVCIRV